MAARTRISMFVAAAPDAIYRAFVEPDWLTRFWLSKASAPLSVGQQVEWHFMVKGVTDNPTAVRLETGKHVSWNWSAGRMVTIELEPFEDGTSVTVTEEGYGGNVAKQVDAALNGTEGFTIVLADLKVLLETGKSPGLTRSKARLIEAALR